MKKREYPQRKIRLVKKQGSIEWVTGLFFLLFLIVFLCAELQLFVYRTASAYLEDALAASNLASAVIDIEEYGISHIVKISDPSQAFERYKSAVKENLQLNDNWECSNSTLISGQVKIEKYIIYNVEDELVTIYSVASDGSIRISGGVLGAVKAPDGNLITNTAVYSEIVFPVKGWWGENFQAHKGKLVDIVAEEKGKGREHAEQKNDT